MREIKFRQKVQNGWHYWGFMSEGHFCGPDTGSMSIKQARENSYQYTNRKDKNDKEIYEGDIIKTSYNETYDFAHYIVVWEEEKAAWYEKCIALHHKREGFKDITRGGYCVGYVGNEKDCEVIGNIRENPESMENVE